VETDFDERLPSVLCLPGELNQAFLNLIVNAAHAIGEKVSSTGEKGKIRIRTQHDEQWVNVHIFDNGAGIPNEIRSRIFDPFFTTKEVGKGTGQGLAMVHTTICENHGGEIEVNNSLDVGTTFIIRLPLNR
jgi:signal transduction histidine kinase